MENLKTWGECVDYTFDTRPTWRNGGGRTSAETYTGYFTRLRSRHWPISKIRPPLINAMSIELEEEGKMDSTINRFITAVSTVLNHCFEMEVIDFKPPRFKRRKEGETQRLHFTKDQVDSIETVSREEFLNDSLADITIGAAYTGMRQGELLSVKARDVDFGANVIHVGGRADNMTKAKNYRAIPIHTRLLPILEPRMENAMPGDRIFGKDWTDRYQLSRQFTKIIQRRLHLMEGYCD
jgi:integrase